MRGGGFGASVRGPAGSSGAAWSLVTTVDYTVPANNTGVTHVFPDPIPLPNGVGCYFVEVVFVGSRTNGPLLVPAQGGVVSPVKFALAVSSDGTVRGLNGSTDVESYWPGNLGCSQIAANLYLTWGRLNIDAHQAARVTLGVSYGVAGEQFRWTAFVNVAGGVNL